MSDQAAVIRSFFDQEALDYARERERQVSFRSQKGIALEMLQGTVGRALDLGCGPAMMEPALLERGFEVWGLDASTKMVEYANRRMADHPQLGRCHLSLGDAERLGWPDGYFDAIISMGVLEYLPSYDRMIGEVRRTLRPGGIAVLSVPSRVSVYHVARSTFEAARAAAKRLLGRPTAPFQAFATRRCVPWRLDAQLERAGFRKVESRFCNFIFFPLHELHPGASNALNRRLEGFSSRAVGAALGTQYIVKVRKPG
jgi:SAM-dependent methyltransferase